MKGKLIVIEGTDASGKHTQATALAAQLREKGKEVEEISFPTYETPFGKLVRKYLDGGFGPLESLPPEIPSMLYAADRLQHRDKLLEWLSKGKIVIANRYVQSNLYSAARISIAGARKSFIGWLKALEPTMPKADAVIFLDVPIAEAQGLLEKRGNVKDLHERNTAYLENVREVYLQQAKAENWTVIGCIKNGKMQSKEEIADAVYKAVAPKLK